MTTCPKPDSACPTVFIHPAHPRIVDDIPLGSGWIYEAHPRGERFQIHTVSGDIEVFDRYGGRVADPPANLSTFATLAPDLVAETWLVRGGRATIAIFTDLHCLQGEAVMNMGYMDRRRLLDSLIRSLPPSLQNVCRMSEILRGRTDLVPPSDYVWARRENASHRSGRSLVWVEKR